MLEESDVPGQDIYGFSKPRKRDGMVLAAASAAQSTSDETKRLENKQKLKNVSTPKHVRRRVKNRISRIVETDTDESDESDFSQSGEAVTDESDDSDDWQPSASSHKREIPGGVTAKFDTAQKLTLNQHCKSKKLSQQIEEFLPQSDDFFRGNNNSNKINTSEHTLDLLKTSRLPIDKIFSLLSRLQTSPEHEKAINTALKEHYSFFLKWLYILNEGFNLLIYGLGSKRQLLQAFCNEFLSKHPVIVVNGFFPSLAVKQILDNIVKVILDMNGSAENSHELVDLIEKEFALIPAKHLFIIIHNIDGPMLRNTNAQAIFGRLAKIDNIHLIASIDHINAPLLWDHTKLSNFNFSWWECTTLLPYSDETAFEDSLLVKDSCGFALSSLRSVFSSLTTNARGIYLLIIAYQLKHKTNPNYQGMPLKDLYWSCREKFLVSSDTALRAQLTEFLDHKLIKSKRSIDGTEHLTIPIDSFLLNEFMEEQSL